MRREALREDGLDQGSRLRWGRRHDGRHEAIADRLEPMARERHCSRFDQRAIGGFRGDPQRRPLDFGSPERYTGPSDVGLLIEVAVASLRDDSPPNKKTTPSDDRKASPRQYRR